MIIYVDGTWSEALGKEPTSEVLRRIFGTKGEEVKMRMKKTM
jgi:hypothetical protein